MYEIRLRVLDKFSQDPIGAVTRGSIYDITTVGRMY
jgi:hypothetical protein